MAVYVVSLSRLVNRRRRPAVAVAQAADKPSDQGPRALPASPKAPPRADRRELPESPRQAAEGLLYRSSSQADELPDLGGESSGKTVLTLIYRMSRLEARLEEVGALLQGRVLPVPMPLEGAEHHQEATNPAQSGLLEQLFRKNVLLRRKD